MLKLRLLWERVSSSLWFIPTLIVLAMIGLALALVELELVSGRDQLAQRYPRLFGAGAQGSRGLLEAIASSMITVAGVSFSITVVALALAASQYTPRIVGNFMRDKANQCVLGVFLGVFAYCLVVLRTIRGGDERLFVPPVAVLVALLLALLAVGCLIFFIHHTAASIQASSIIAGTAAQTLAAVDRLFPAQLGEPTQGQSGAAAESAADAQARWCALYANKTGYIQAVDANALIDLAKKRSTIVRVSGRIGDFVIEGSTLAEAAGCTFSEAELVQLNRAFSIEEQRTLQQDAGYGIRQLVDMALRALSPGINDTTTAINCVDYLGAITARLLARQQPSPYRTDGGDLRLVARGRDFSELLYESFDEIVRAARGNFSVLQRVLGVLSVLAPRACTPERMAAIQVVADVVVRCGEQGLPLLEDRRRLFDLRASLPRAAPLAGRAEAAGNHAGGEAERRDS